MRAERIDELHAGPSAGASRGSRGGGLRSSALAAVDAFCDGTDPALLSGTDCAEAMPDVSLMIKRLTAVQAGMAGRVEETRAYRATHKDAVGWLASTGGTSPGEAARMLRTNSRLGSCEATREAFVAGELSLAEADLVSQGATADPSAEADLVELATRRHDLKATRERSERVRRGAHRRQEEAERAAKVRASRRWCESHDVVDAAPRIDAKFVPEDYATIKAIVAKFQQRIFEANRQSGNHQPPVADAADAVLAAIVAGGTTIGFEPPPFPFLAHVPGLPGISEPSDRTGSEPVNREGQGDLFDEGDESPESSDPGDSGDDSGPRSATRLGRPCVLVDAIALRRGYVASGETCEIPGVGPVDLNWARQLIDQDIFDVVIHDGVDILTVASSTRHIPRPLRVALEVRDRSCTNPTCGETERLEIDHVVDYATSRDTSYRNLNPLCAGKDGDHDAKTHRGARVERHGNEWWWYPPPDPARPGQPVEPLTQPVGRHLTPWNLDHLPGTDPDPPPDDGPPRLDLGPAPPLAST